MAPTLLIRGPFGPRNRLSRGAAAQQLTAASDQRCVLVEIVGPKLVPNASMAAGRQERAGVTRMSSHT
jgi:hypothetical protein